MQRVGLRHCIELAICCCHFVRTLYSTALHFYCHLGSWSGADPGGEIGGGHMASAEREPIIGVWGLCPQRGPGAEPLVRGRSPPEAERFLVLSYVWNGVKLLCLWAVLWSLMVAAVPTCVRGSWVLIFHPWFGGPWPVPPPLWIRPWICKLPSKSFALKMDITALRQCLFGLFQQKTRKS